jgi:type I restriction enzyme, S subunit
MVPLGEVANFVRGINFKPDDVVKVGSPGTVACMRTRNVQDELDLSDVWAVADEFVRRDEQYLREGDVLISSANSWNLVGKCSWIPALPWRSSFGGFVSVVRPSSTSLDSRFLYRWFSSDPVQATLRSFGQKTTNISNLNIERCRRLTIPLPPLREQRRIAAILDQAETLRSQRRAALAQIDILAQSIFLDMFGAAPAQGWPVATIADIADPRDGSVRTGPFGSQLLHSEFVSEGVAVLGIDNAVSNIFRWGERRFITAAKYRELQRYTVKSGDVLITIMGTCGRCAVVPDDVPVAINTKHLCCITVDAKRCVPAFLHAYFLQHPMARKYLEQTAKGAIMSGLNMGIIKAMPIPVPPLCIQQAFATRIQAIESLKATHRAALAELDALFASLQQRAFSGELTCPAVWASTPANSKAHGLQPAHT